MKEKILQIRFMSSEDSFLVWLMGFFSMCLSIVFPL